MILNLKIHISEKEFNKIAKRLAKTKMEAKINVSKIVEGKKFTCTAIHVTNEPVTYNEGGIKVNANMRLPEATITAMEIIKIK